MPVNEQLAPLYVAYAGLLGAVLGSFLNVCILRWGAEPKQSVVRPRSRCPRCGRALAWYDNIPVLSWLILRARCRGCGEPISIQYPLIEIATGCIWAYMVWRHGPTLEALRGATFGSILLGIAMTDAREYIIPHEFSIGGTVLALALSVWPEPIAMLASLEGALFGAGLVLLIGELSELALGQEAMGGGDCALMGMVGAFLGWQAVIPVLFIGAVISTFLFILTAVLPRRSNERASAVDSAPVPQAGAFRWGMVLRLSAAGAVPILGLIVTARVGVLGEALGALFYGLLAAGLAYYLSLVLPSAAANRPWARVIGLAAAGLGIAVGAGLSVPWVAIGLLFSAALVWYSRRIHVVPTPDTTQALVEHGYLPFGVGLAIAAGILLFSGAVPRIREIVLEYGNFLRAS